MFIYFEVVMFAPTKLPEWPEEWDWDMTLSSYYKP